MLCLHSKDFVAGELQGGFCKKTRRSVLISNRDSSNCLQEGLTAAVYAEKAMHEHVFWKKFWPMEHPHWRRLFILWKQFLKKYSPKEVLTFNKFMYPHVPCGRDLMLEQGNSMRIKWQRGRVMKCPQLYPDLF